MLKRDIVFRGKSKSTGEWVEGSLIGNDVIVGKIVEFEEDYFCTEFWYKVDPETVGQFTGMTDKNGTMIFEGDILNEPSAYKDDIYQVFWDEDYFSFRVKSGRVDYYLDEMQKYHCEVVGNIYDNK